jgi:hypothetical protein
MKLFQFVWRKKKAPLDNGIESLTIKSIDQLPTPDTIRCIPRGKKLRLIFAPSVEKKRESIGEQLKSDLEGFHVGIPTFSNEIYIAKLIADEEIAMHQDFFEKCAKDYRRLSTELINKLIDQLGITINTAFPLLTFNLLKNSERQVGEVDGWRYYLHGYHCGFTHLTTGQQIETSLVFGLEFGELDPYFFTRFIKSTPAYQPLPVGIYEDYADGVRINKKMVALGKFEVISSNIENTFGVVVTDRDKIPVEVYRENL